jgi:hypothetical protein
MIQVAWVKSFHIEESLSLRLFINVQITHSKMKISYYEAEIADFYYFDSSTSTD